MKDLTQLTRFEDRLSFLYLEKGRIEQHHTSVAYVTEREIVPIPAASLALLMVGAGHHDHPCRHPEPSRLRLSGDMVR